MRNPHPLARRMIALNENGWLELYSKILGESIYFIKHQYVVTPKDLVRYTLKEALMFKGLSDEEIVHLHGGKKIFNGEVIK